MLRWALLIGLCLFAGSAPAQQLMQMDIDGNSSSSGSAPALLTDDPDTNLLTDDSGTNLLQAQ
jgi:hypothetical protein